MTDADTELPIDLTGNPVQVCTPESLKRRLLARRTPVGMPKAARPDQGNCFSTVGDDFGMSEEETQRGSFQPNIGRRLVMMRESERVRLGSDRMIIFLIAILHIIMSQSPLENHAEQDFVDGKASRNARRDDPLSTFLAKTPLARCNQLRCRSFWAWLDPCCLSAR
jgi:hypothetical protein